MLKYVSLSSRAMRQPRALFKVKHRFNRPRDAVEVRVVALWTLTPAEARMVDGLAAGPRPVDIATLHGLSVHTVRTQLKRAMAKAGVHTQAALVARAYLAKRHDSRG